MAAIRHTLTTDDSEFVLYTETPLGDEIESADFLRSGD